jgi:hypothetical protein
MKKQRQIPDRVAHGLLYPGFNLIPIKFPKHESKPMPRSRKINLQEVHAHASVPRDHLCEGELNRIERGQAIMTYGQSLLTARFGRFSSPRHLGQLPKYCVILLCRTSAATGQRNSFFVLISRTLRNGCGS